jgi:glycosyltransferase involved in cell wall biosynthesis
MPRVTLFFPMHDERESVRPMAEKALGVLAGFTPDFELLIVDDGSRDGSGELADALAAEDARVRVVHHAVNRGYGQALRTGFAEARGDIVAYTDCDEPADLQLLPEAVRLFDDAALDMVIGYRLQRDDTPRRWLYSKGCNLLVRVLFGVRVRDVNFAFKLIRRQALRRLSLQAESAFIDGELLSEAARHGLRLAQIPVVYRLRAHGHSHFDSLGAATAALKDLWRYWRRRSRLA